MPSDPYARGPEPAAQTGRAVGGNPGRLVNLLSSDIAQWLLTTFSACGFATGCAWLIRRRMTRIPRSQDEPQHRILLLRRSIFHEDMQAVLAAAGSIEAFVISRGDLKAIAKAFLPADVGDENYVSASAEAKQAMERYRTFLKRVWRAFDPQGAVDAVVTANYVYYAERELAGALEETGVAFIVLQKENSWSLGAAAHTEWVYRHRCGPFFGRRILVYSEQEKGLEVRAGVADGERIEVVGSPRLDKVHEWRRQNAGSRPARPMILFASFLPRVGMPRRDPSMQPAATAEPAPELSVTKLSRSAHRAMVDLARAAPEIVVRIKTKGRRFDRYQLLDLLGVRGTSELPSNLEIVHGGSPFVFVKEASVVCGLQSTLLLEALAAGRPVVVPWYAEALRPEVNAFLFDLGDAAIKVGSAGELIAVARSLALARSSVLEELAPEVSRLLEEWLGNGDGRASQRAARAILSVVQKNAGPTYMDSRAIHFRQ
jgi:hypothetical protein